MINENLQENIYGAKSNKELRNRKTRRFSEVKK